MAKQDREIERPSPGDSGPRREGDPPVVTGMTPLVARVVWFFLGPMVLLVTLWGILSQGSGWITLLDGFYLVIVVLMIGARWVEQRSGQATTAMGERATWADFRRYATLLVPLAAGAWIAANAVGNHLLDGMID
jgi:hypothetical protein